MIRNVVVMAAKDLLLLWRDRFGMFWIVVFPLVYAAFFGAIFGGDGDDVPGMRVAVVDLDDSEGSRAFVADLDASDALRALTEDSEGTPLDLEAARHAVRRGRVVAYVALPPGFGDVGFEMFGGRAPELEVGLDPARKAEAGYLEGLLMQAAFGRVQDLFSDPSVMRDDLRKLIADVESDPSIAEDQRRSLLDFLGSAETFAGDLEATPAEGEGSGEDGSASPQASGGLAMQPIRIRKESVMRAGSSPPSAWSISFPQAMVWGLIGCTAGFSISLVQERTRGTWMRLRTAPHSDAVILAGKGLACFGACVGVIALLFGVGSFFGVEAPSLALLALAAAATAFCFTGMMMAISTLGRTERAVAGAGWAAMMPFPMVGGGMIPLVAMPGWMQSLSHWSPVKWAVLAVEGATWRGFSSTELGLPVGILLGVGLASFGIGVWRMRSWSVA